MVFRALALASSELVSVSRKEEVRQVRVITNYGECETNRRLDPSPDAHCYCVSDAVRKGHGFVVRRLFFWRLPRFADEYPKYWSGD